MITKPLVCAANKTLPSGRRLYAGEALCYYDNSAQGDPILREGMTDDTTAMLYEIRQRQFGLSDAGHPVYLEWRRPSSSAASQEFEPHIIWEPFGPHHAQEPQGEYLVIEQDTLLLYEHVWGAVRWAAGHCGTPSEPYGLILTAEGLVMLGTMASIRDDPNADNDDDDELALWTLHPGGMEERICGTIALPTSSSGNNCQCYGNSIPSAGFALAFAMMGAVLMWISLWCRSPRPPPRRQTTQTTARDPFSDKDTIELTIPRF
uniref:Uncharacterized protein n=1 Tax=Amphora coffeiformis TaxID=265554 RepID=A0A7S3LBE9_9STRA|eukprot:scaffold19245_cov199-Amphora_coffeaeformis.AAC.18